VSRRWQQQQEQCSSHSSADRRAAAWPLLHAQREHFVFCGSLLLLLVSAGETVACDRVLPHRARAG
jgi:hypothetical protein